MVTRCMLKKGLAGLMLSAWAMGMPLVALSATTGEVFNPKTDGYGAVITGSTGVADITGMGTKSANILMDTVTKGAKIDWDVLNIRKDEKLNFTFGQDGQVVLNNVANGMSKFAGSLTTNGPNTGHLVISNKNGVFMLKGSSIEGGAGSVTLTTHELNPDGDFANNGKAQTGAESKYYGINIDGAKINTIGDFNIIAPGIVVQNANIFSGNTRLVSADGVTFVQVPSTDKLALDTTNVQTFKQEQLHDDINPLEIQYGTTNGTYTTIDKLINKKLTKAIPAGALDIDGLKPAVYLYKTNFDGKTAVFASNDIMLDGVKFNADAVIVAQNTEKFRSDDGVYYLNDQIGIYVNNSIFNGTGAADRTDLSTLLAGGTAIYGVGDNVEVDIANSTINNALIGTKGTIKLFDSRSLDWNDWGYAGVYMYNSAITGTASDASQIITEGYNSGMFFDKVTLKNVDAKTSGDYAGIDVTYKSSLTDTKLTTAGKESDIVLSNSTLKNVDAKTEGDHAWIDVINKSSLTDTKLTTAGDYANIFLVNSTLKNIDANTSGDYSYITIDDKSSLTDTKLTTAGDYAYITLNNSTLKNIDVKTKGEYAMVSVSNSTISKSTLTAEGDNSIISAALNSKLTDVNLNLLGENSEIVIGSPTDPTDKKDKDTTSVTNSFITVGAANEYNNGVLWADNAAVAQNSKVNIQGNGAKVSGTEITTYAQGTEVNITNKANVSNSTVTTNGAGSLILIDGGYDWDFSNQIPVPILVSGSGAVVSGSTFTAKKGNITVTGGSSVTGDGKKTTFKADADGAQIYVNDGAILNKVIADISGNGAYIIIGGAGTTVKGNSLLKVSEGNNGGVYVINNAIINGSTIQLGDINDPNVALDSWINISDGAQIINSKLLAYSGGTMPGDAIWIGSTSPGIAGPTVKNSTILTTADDSYINISGEGTDVSGTKIQTSGEGSEIRIYDKALVSKSTITTTADDASVIINGEGTNVSGSKITTGVTTKATKTTPAVITGEGSSIIVSDKAVVKGSTLTTNGVVDFSSGGTNHANIEILDGGKITGKSVLNINGNGYVGLRGEGAELSGKSTINLNGGYSGLTFLEGSIGDNLTINAKGEYSSVELFKGFGALPSDDAPILSNSKINMSNKTYNGFMMDEGAVLDNSTVTVKSGNIYIYDSGIIDSSLTTSNGNLVVTGNSVINAIDKNVALKVTNGSLIVEGGAYIDDKKTLSLTVAGKSPFYDPQDPSTKLQLDAGALKYMKIGATQSGKVTYSPKADTKYIEVAEAWEQSL